MYAGMAKVLVLVLGRRRRSVGKDAITMASKRA